MAEALIAGMLRRGFNPRRILAADRDSKRLKRLRNQFKIGTFPSNGEIAAKSDLLVLATKPQDLIPVLKEVGSKADGKALVLSIAAGIDVETLSKGLKAAGKKHAPMKIIRAMPNNPALIGQGVTALFTFSALSPGQRRAVEAVFQGSGDFLWVKNEKWLDAVTALSGSGPAYLYSFVEALSEGGRKAGLPSDLAYRLALQTTLGAALTLKETKKTPAELQALVTSKKGTTLAGLAVMKKAGFPQIMARTIRAAARRARQIRMEMKKV